MVKISSGVDRESEKNIGEKLRLLSPNWFMSNRLERLINRLYIVGLIQIMLFFDNQVRGISIVVGIMYFSIGVGLGFVHNQCHMYLILLLVGTILVLLHRPRRLVG